MRLVICFVLISLVGPANATECSSQLWQQKVDLSSQYRVEATLSNNFSYITAILGFRKAAHKDGAINMIRKIDNDLYLRIVQIILYSRNEPQADFKTVNTAIDTFLKDTDYYPLTWSQEFKDDFKSYRRTLNEKRIASP